MNLFGHFVAMIIAIICVFLGGKGHKYMDDVYVPDMNHVVDNIYLGNWTDSTNWGALKNEGITHILTLNRKRWHTEERLNDMKANGITNMFICIDDVARADMSQHFNDCIKFIKGADKVLVHCSAGVSRSVTIVIAYLVREKNMGADEALEFIRTKRPRANPNEGFMSQLYKL